MINPNNINTGAGTAKASGSQKSKTWMAGKSCPVGQPPVDDPLYRAQAQVAGAESELKADNNSAFRQKVLPYQQAIWIGLATEQAYFVERGDIEGVKELLKQFEAEAKEKADEEAKAKKKA